MVVNQNIVRDPVHTIAHGLIPLRQFFKELVIGLVLITVALHDPGSKELEVCHKTLVIPILIVQRDLK